MPGCTSRYLGVYQLGTNNLFSILIGKLLEPVIIKENWNYFSSLIRERELEREVIELQS